MVNVQGSSKNDESDEDVENMKQRSHNNNLDWRETRKWKHGKN